MSNYQTSQTLWLTLANAFMAPMREEQFLAFKQFLAEDLAEMCDELGIDVSPDLCELSARLRDFDTPQDLLVDYSHLFLQPPIPATLNLGRYVDGSINGPCLDALENAYQAARVEQRETLKDIGDHAVMQMECLAYLIGRSADEARQIDAEEFANLCLVGALPRLADAIDAESPGSPYAALAHIAAKSVIRFARESKQEDPQPKKRRHDTAAGVWRHCSACQKPFAREKEIAIMTRALEQAGLPAEHLGLCPDCRDAARGFFRRSVK